MPRIFTISVPTVLGDTPEKRAKARRDFETIMREAVFYFTAAEVRGLLKEITKQEKQGRRESIKGRLLEEYDAAVRDTAPKRVNKSELAGLLCEKYHLHSPEAVERRLNRLLENRRKAEAKKKG